MPIHKYNLNRDALPHLAHGPCEWNPEAGRESYLSDFYHGAARGTSVFAPTGRFKGKPIRVCRLCYEILK